MVGMCLALLVGSSSASFVLHCLPVVAGQFLFIAMAQLLPPELMDLHLFKTKLAAVSSIRLLGAAIIAVMMMMPIALEIKCTINFKSRINKRSDLIKSKHACRWDDTFVSEE